MHPGQDPGFSAALVKSEKHKPRAFSLCLEPILDLVRWEKKASGRPQPPPVALAPCLAPAVRLVIFAANKSADVVCWERKEKHYTIADKPGR